MVDSNIRDIPNIPKVFVYEFYSPKHQQIIKAKNIKEAMKKFMLQNESIDIVAIIEHNRGSDFILGRNMVEIGKIVSPQKMDALLKMIKDELEKPEPPSKEVKENEKTDPVIDPDNITSDDAHGTGKPNIPGSKGNGKGSSDSRKSSTRSSSKKNIST